MAKNSDVPRRGIWVDEAIARDKRLKWAAKAVLAQIAFKSHGKTHWDATMEHIGHYLGLEPRAVRDIVAELETSGRIKVVRIEGRPNRYTIPETTVALLPFDDADPYENRQGTPTKSGGVPLRKSVGPPYENRQGTPTKSVGDPYEKAQGFAGICIPVSRSRQDNRQNVVDVDAGALRSRLEAHRFSEADLEKILAHEPRRIEIAEAVTNDQAAKGQLRNGWRPYFLSALAEGYLPEPGILTHTEKLNQEAQRRENLRQADEINRRRAELEAAAIEWFSELTFDERRELFESLPMEERRAYGHFRNPLVGVHLYQRRKFNGSNGNGNGNGEHR